jgi:hypothetical protein
MLWFCSVVIPPILSLPYTTILPPSPLPNAIPTESFFCDLYRVLRPGGQLTIVSDNRLYLHSLVATIDQLNSTGSVCFTSPSGSLDREASAPGRMHHSVNSQGQGQGDVSDSSDESIADQSSPNEENGEEEGGDTTLRRKVNGEKRNRRAHSGKGSSAVKDLPGRSVGRVSVCSGGPGETGGHLTTDESSSYFSRMWKNGSNARVWHIILIKDTKYD